MARILFVVPRRHPNLRFAIEALVGAGHDVCVLAAEPMDYPAPEGLRDEAFGSTPDRDAVARSIAQFDPEIVFLRKSGPLSELAGEILRRHRAQIFLYDQRPATRRRKTRALWKDRLRGRPWRRVTPVPGLDRDRPVAPDTRYLPWPVDLLESGRVAPPPDAPLRVLFVGKLAQPRKNHLTVVEALRPLAAEGSAHLTFVGTTTLAASGADANQLTALRDLAGREPWIEVVEDVPHDEMGRVYATHHACVLPSFNEPLGTAPLEGMPYGTIPLISIEAGSAGCITDGVDGYRIDPRDGPALGARFRDLAEDPSLRARLSDGACHTARTELSPETFLARVDRLLAGRNR